MNTIFFAISVPVITVIVQFLKKIIIPDKFKKALPFLSGVLGILACAVMLLYTGGIGSVIELIINGLVYGFSACGFYCACEAVYDKCKKKK